MILLLACAEPEAPSAAAPSTTAAATAPDLVLIGVAGLRSDPVSRTSDWFFQAYASEHGVVFSNAYAATPSTFVSLGSLLTGRYPSNIPMCGFPWDPEDPPGQAPWCTTLPDVPTLPSVLALYGYRTALLTADVQGAASLGVPFQDRLVVSERWSDTTTDWQKVTEAATKWWDADATHPRLLVVATAGMNVRTARELREKTGLDKVDSEGAPTDVNGRRVLGRYREAATQAGKDTHALLDTLRGRSTRPTWAAVFGINGINLGDSSVPSHALRGRSWSDILIDRTVHVPLALVGPSHGPAAHIESQVVELVDLLPTLVKLGGGVVPASLPGQDLLSLTTDPEATAYAEFGDMLAVRRGDWFWSVRAFFFNRSSLDPELTNFVVDYRPNPAKMWLNRLENDPFQERNLLQSEPAQAEAMNALLVRLRTGPGAPPPGGLDARKIWELRMSPADGYW